MRIWATPNTSMLTVNMRAPMNSDDIGRYQSLPTHQDQYGDNTHLNFPRPCWSEGENSNENIPFKYLKTLSFFKNFFTY